jgi:hypothetical protein
MTIDQLAYLKSPDKIRAAMINTTGRAPSIAVIERRLKELEPKLNRWDVGEPTDEEGQHFVVRGLVEPEPVKVERPKPPKVSKPRKPWVPRKPTATLLSEKLVKLVCEEMRLDVAEFYSTSRLRPYVHARAIVCQVLRERNEKIYSWERLGACIARTDHSTVGHLLKNFDVYCRTPGVWEVYDRVRDVVMRGDLG